MSAKGIDEGRLLDDRIEALRTSERLATDDVIEFLVELPDETRIEHRIDVENLVARVPTAVEHLRTILDREGLVFEDADAASVRFGAFLALHAHHLRNRDRAALQRLHEEHDHRFSGRPMYDAARAEYLRLRGGTEHLARAVGAFEDAIEAVPGNAWLHHALAETVAEALEDGDPAEYDREEYRDRARTAVDRAIDLRPGYGTYHVTRGRLLALSGEYDRARGEMERGIHLTEADRSDYGLRVARFQRHLLGVEIREERARLDDELDAVETRIGEVGDRAEERLAAVEDRAEDRLDRLTGRLERIEERTEDRLDRIEERSESSVGDFRTAALQFLGFFAAVLAAVLLTVQVAVTYPPPAAGALVLMVFGGLTASLGAFTLVVGEETGRSEAAMVVVGLLVLAGGFAATTVV